MTIAAAMTSTGMLQDPRLRSWKAGDSRLGREEDLSWMSQKTVGEKAEMNAVTVWLTGRKRGGMRKTVSRGADGWLIFYT